MQNEEIDFDQAKPVKQVAEVNPEKTVNFFMGEEPNKLQPKEITEEMVARLYDNMEEAKQLESLIAMDKKDIKELVKDQTTLMVGKFIILLTHKKGQRKVKWEKLAKDLIGKISEDDLDKYTETGEESVSLSIRKKD